MTRKPVSRFHPWWIAASGAVLIAPLALPAQAAGPLPTIRVNPPAAPAAATHADDDFHFAGRTAFTVGIGIDGDGFGSEGTTTSALYWGGLSHYDRHWYVSGRAFHAYANYNASRPDPNQDCCSDNLYETALTVGVPLNDNRLLWVGTGLSRLQRTKGDPGYDRNYVTASAPIELIFTNVRHPVGVEGRLIVDLAGHGKNYVGALFGLNFGG